jgi:hypothetical protein
MAEGAIDILSLGFNAAAAITQYTAVKMSDADTVTPVTAEGDVIIGVSQFGVSAAEITRGKGASVRVGGISLMVVGTGGVTVGTLGVSDATGKVVASNTGARPLGLVLATGAAGDLIPVLLTPGLPLIP